MEIFVVIDGKKTGPMSIYEVRELLRKDKINTSTLAWVKGMTKWEPLKECPPFRNSIDIEIAEADRDSIIINSEERKSILEPSPNLSKAKPWIRLWAKLIDSSINSFLGILFLTNYLGRSKLNELIGLDALQKTMSNESTAQPEIDTLVLILTSICISWILTETLLMSIFSTTLGKWILNVKTSKINGKRIDPLSAFASSFLVLFLGFGYWVVPFLFKFPIFSYFFLICPIISYFSLLKRKITQWDRLLKLEVTHNEVTPTRIIAAIFSFILINNLVGLLLLSPEQISP